MALHKPKVATPKPPLITGGNSQPNINTRVLDFLTGMEDNFEGN